jgi:hypothetical protein
MNIMPEIIENPRSVYFAGKDILQLRIMPVGIT